MSGPGDDVAGEVARWAADHPGWVPSSPEPGTTVVRAETGAMRVELAFFTGDPTAMVEFFELAQVRGAILSVPHEDRPRELLATLEVFEQFTPAEFPAFLTALIERGFTAHDTSGEDDELPVDPAYVRAISRWATG